MNTPHSGSFGVATLQEVGSVSRAEAQSPNSNPNRDFLEAFLTSQGSQETVSERPASWGDVENSRPLTAQEHLQGIRSELADHPRSAFDFTTDTLAGINTRDVITQGPQTLFDGNVRSQAQQIEQARQEIATQTRQPKEISESPELPTAPVLPIPSTPEQSSERRAQFTHIQKRQEYLQKIRNQIQLEGKRSSVLVSGRNQTLGIHTNQQAGEIDATTGTLFVKIQRKISMLRKSAVAMQQMRLQAKAQARGKGPGAFEGGKEKANVAAQEAYAQKVAPHEQQISE